MIHPSSAAAEPRPPAASPSASGLARLRKGVLGRVKAFVRAHEMSLLLGIAAAAMLAYLSLEPAPLAAPAGSGSPDGSVSSSGNAAAPSAKASRSPARPRVSSAKARASTSFQVRATLGIAAKARESQARLVLTQDGISLTATERPRQLLRAIPYDRVLSIAYSHGRDPMWESAKWPMPLRRSGGALRKLGLFVERHWIVLQTGGSDRFVILRVEDSTVNKLLDALAERTGRRPDVIAPR
jgi:hypothetical protein